MLEGVYGVGDCVGCWKVGRALGCWSVCRCWRVCRCCRRRLEGCWRVEVMCGVGGWRAVGVGG